MPELYCVRGNFGEYTNNFIKDNYVAIGWFEDFDLSSIESREELRDIYPKHHPEDNSPYMGYLD